MRGAASAKVLKSVCLASWGMRGGQCGERRVSEERLVKVAISAITEERPMGKGLWSVERIWLLL